MKATIVVLTPERALSQNVGIGKTSLIPADLRTCYPNLSITSYEASGATTAEILAAYFRKVSSGATGVIVLCDNRLAALVADLTTPFFTVLYDNSLGGKNLHNYFGMILSRTIKAFAAYYDRFDNEKNRKLLILPLRNFDALDLRRLHLLFRNGVRANGEFHNTLDQLLKALRSRQQPKTETSFATTYLVDDRDRYFVYAKEIHSQIETGIPPHNLICEISGNYRFGKKFDSARHFNVSFSEARIHGAFQNCHGSNVDQQPCSHLNMFPNDFFGAK